MVLLSTARRALVVRRHPSVPQTLTPRPTCNYVRYDEGSGGGGGGQVYERSGTGNVVSKAAY
ncbi:expressed unknown protein [Ectocarpus siliculosus]|uniref:Uncharacterized protein n=1 Tax=Ectocarpus siliculosus TaxID=2880 RepID=D8LGD2_ECTSI|nr:expressed unknown protein [Ectocarpus siliculosus]|eukprot:CBN79031.1 expressed unknown protein [Ectocarpus siliculosus]